MDSTFAFIKSGAEQGFLIYRELQKIPILERLVTIAEQSGRAEMALKYSERLEVIESNVGEALSSYGDSLEGLTETSRIFIDRGLRDYRDYLTKRDADEQSKAFEVYERHLLSYLDENEGGPEGWRADYAQMQ